MLKKNNLLTSQYHFGTWPRKRTLGELFGEAEYKSPMRCCFMRDNIRSFEGLSTRVESCESSFWVLMIGNSDSARTWSYFFCTYRSRCIAKPIQKNHSTRVNYLMLSFVQLTQVNFYTFKEYMYLYITIYIYMRRNIAKIFPEIL